MSTNNYLVTGGAGFIGGTLARRLSALGHSVTILDLPEKIEMAKEWLGTIECCAGNVADPATFASLPKKTWTAAFHLAAQTSARISEEKPGIDIDTNVKGAQNFCDWARKSRPGFAVFTSSMAVYGWSGDNISEDQHPKPVSVYGVTKSASEHFFRILKEDGVPTRIYRLFNVYGPGQDFFNLSQGMLSIFLAQALTKPEILVTGTFDRYRDFVYVDDVVEALMLKPEGEEWILNVGNGIPVRVGPLLDRIVKAVSAWNPDVKVRQVESHRGDVFGNYANIDRLKATGWRPAIDLEQGLLLTVPDARKALGCK